jgi:Holliday junction resolvasome RuvABC endonuclease subunit
VRTLGIDYSSRAVDLCFLDADTLDAHWHSLPLERGIAGLRQIRYAYSWASELEDVYLVAIEDPMSAGRTSAKQLGRVCGAIVAALPRSVPTEHVWTLRPDEWRMAIGLPGNGSKAQVAAWAHDMFGVQVELYSQDAVDALAMAFAAREINARALEAA